MEIKQNKMSDKSASGIRRRLIYIIFFVILGWVGTNVVSETYSLKQHYNSKIEEDIVLFVTLNIIGSFLSLVLFSSAVALFLVLIVLNLFEMWKSGKIDPVKLYMEMSSKQNQGMTKSQEHKRPMRGPSIALDLLEDIEKSKDGETSSEEIGQKKLGTIHTDTSDNIPTKSSSYFDFFTRHATVVSSATPVPNKKSL